MKLYLFLGNTNIHRITSQGYYDLKIDLEDFEGNTRYALYKNFSVSSEDDFFTLSIGTYSGDAGIFCNILDTFSTVIFVYFLLIFLHFIPFLFTICVVLVVDDGIILIILFS